MKPYLKFYIVFGIIICSSIQVLGFNIYPYHHASGVCEVNWRYVTGGELYRIDTLIERAVNSSKGWNGVDAGLIFTKATITSNQWGWYDYPDIRLLGLTFLCTTGVLIDSIITILNKTI
jgi:hypothetical protein